MYNWGFVELFHLKTIDLGGITEGELFSLLILNFNLNLKSYNQFQNIFRLSHVLPHFPFTTSETMGKYYL